jgi:hypothetical protein
MLLRGTSLRGVAASSFGLRGGEFSFARSFPHKRDIGTLDPVRLTSADFLDLGGKTMYSRQGLNLGFLRRDRSAVPFPSDAQGFLYYIPGPEHAPVAGEVRFRATPDPNPASFADGRDLLLPDRPGPWNVPLINMLPHAKCYKYLLDLLVNKDQVVSSELVASSRAHKIPNLLHSSQLLHTLGQPIIIDVSHRSFHLRIASGSRVYNTLRFNLPRAGQGKTDKKWDSPYAGTL